MHPEDTTGAPKTAPSCATCGLPRKPCRTGEGELPPTCPPKLDTQAFEWARRQYSDLGVSEFARQASIQEAECYTGRDGRPYVLHPVKTRIEETAEFARRMGYRRLGLAFCAGLQEEARTLAGILEARGFEVVSVVCKAGAEPKESIGIEDDQKVRIGQFESMCNPIAQAAVLNAERTDFNIVVGLCVGHDSLFLKYAHALSTVLIATDRVLAHAPAAALHTASSYYPWLGKPR
jgi:uncharacterized metal-binding protein